MTTTLTIRLDDALKHEAEQLFQDIGMNLTTAITCFFKKSLAVNAIPFTLDRKRPNAETMAALEEARQIAQDPKATSYDNMDAFVRSLES